jgi:hypothetical protein
VLDEELDCDEVDEVTLVVVALELELELAPPTSGPSL